MDNYYYVALIIVTIIGFALSIILSLYFVYLPAQRSAASFDDLYKRGTEIIDNAAKNVKYFINKERSTLNASLNIFK